MENKNIIGVLLLLIAGTGAVFAHEYSNAKDGVAAESNDFMYDMYEHHTNMHGDGISYEEFEEWHQEMPGFDKENMFKSGWGMMREGMMG